MEINADDVKSFLLGSMHQYGVSPQTMIAGMKAATFALEGKAKAVDVEVTTITESASVIVL